MRVIAVQIHNILAEKPIRETEYWPLPGDQDRTKVPLSGYTDPDVIFNMLSSAFPGEVTVEYHAHAA